MKKFRCAFLATLVFATPLAAHDFWIQPQRFQTQTGVPFAGTFQVGHAAYRQRWGRSRDHILLLNDVSPAGIRNIRAALMDDGAADFVTRFDNPGVHILAMQSTYARSELPAVRFNDYAKVEGLTPIIAERKRTGKTAAPGRERYSRRAKALIRVGSLTGGNQSLATRAVGLKLEIVPERNPYDLGGSRILPVRVMYKGRRLPGATVKLTNLEFDAKPLATAVTDGQGRARFRVPPVGEWLVNVIWSEPIRGDPAADFDTTFSSLTFGYDPAKHRR